MDTRVASRRTGRRQGHISHHGVVRVGPLMSVPAVMRELGCDPEPLFRSAGFAVAQFDDADARIPYLAASRLIARCTEATACEHFGLLVGQRAGPSSLGVAGFLLRAAPDVKTALQDLVRHLGLHDDGGVPFVETAGEVSLLGYSIQQPGTQASGQIYDLSMAIGCNIMRALCGETWRANEVLFARRRPDDPRPYERFFQAPLRFDAEQSAVVFPNRWLEHRPASADPLLHRHLEGEANALHARQHADVAHDLRRLLHRLLSTRKTSIASVARQLGVHERTLNRRLRAEGTTFQREYEEVRYTVALQMLADSRMTLAQIAAALDYADASAFNRAFKRWAGITPAQWRAQRASRSNA